MALSSCRDAMEQGTAAVVRGPAGCLVPLAEVLFELGRGVASEVGDAETGADEVDDDARLFDGDELAGEVADRKRLGKFGEGVPGTVSHAAQNPGVKKTREHRKEERKARKEPTTESPQPPPSPSSPPLQTPPTPPSHQTPPY